MRKTYILDQETEEFKSNQARIDRTFDIYLEPYKSELDAFAATVDVSLVGEVHIDITVTLNSPGQYEDTLTRGIAIPLSSEFYTIATHGDAESVKEHTILEKPISIWTTILLSLAVIVGIAGFLAALKKLIDRRSAFLREVNGYLKSYDDIIVNTSSPIVFDNYKIVAIESFKELLTLSNKTNNPIMYWTGDNNAYFYVLTHGLMFLFIVKDKG
jgi:hypothetical protein